MKFIMPNEAFAGPEVHAEVELARWEYLRDSACSEEEYMDCSSRVSECLMELQWMEAWDARQLDS